MRTNQREKRYGARNAGKKTGKRRTKKDSRRSCTTSSWVNQGAIMFCLGAAGVLPIIITIVVYVSLNFTQFFPIISMKNYSFSRTNTNSTINTGFFFFRRPPTIMSSTRDSSRDKRESNENNVDIEVLRKEYRNMQANRNAFAHESDLVRKN